MTDSVAVYFRKHANNAMNITFPLYAIKMEKISNISVSFSFIRLRFLFRLSKYTQTMIRVAQWGAENIIYNAESMESKNKFCT